jgi:hypothetical protein
MKRGFRLAAVVFAGALALGACGGDDDDDDDTGGVDTEAPAGEGVELSGEDREEVIRGGIEDAAAQAGLSEEDTQCLVDEVLAAAPDPLSSADYPTTAEFGEDFEAAIEACGVTPGGGEEEPVEEEVEE